jgi:tyrosine-protein kinase Etk/Wzc
MIIPTTGESSSPDQGSFQRKTPTGNSTPRELWNKYKQYSKYLVLSLIVCLAASWTYLRYTSPIYKGTINLLIDVNNDNSEDITDQILDKLSSGNKINIANQLQILTSATLMERVVRRTGVNKTIIMEGKINDVKLYDSLTNSYCSFDNVTDSNRSYIMRFEIKNKQIYQLTPKSIRTIPNNTPISEPGIQYSLHFDSAALARDKSTYIVTWNPIKKTAAKLATSIDVKQPDKEASIILLSLSSDIPQEIKDILNTLAAEYSKQAVEENNRKAENKIKFVESRLLLLSGELGDVETKLTDFREKNNVINPEAQSTDGLSNLNTIKGKLDQAAVKLQVAAMIRSYVTDSSKKFDLVPSSMGFEDLTLVGLVKDYNQDVLIRENLLKTVTRQSMPVIKLEEQIQVIRTKITESIDNIKSSLQSDYDKSNQDYQATLSDMKSIPEKEKQFLEISRQQGVKEKLYLFLLQKREESSIDKASTVSNSTPIDPATTLPFPIYPSKTVFYLLAIFLGLGIPVLIIYIRSLLDDKVITREDVTNYTNVPIVGEVSHCNPADIKESPICINKTRGGIAEQLRIFRTNMQYMSKGKERLTMLITSTISGEGKSFLSINIAAVLAVSGKKTVLLEFDLRKPRISRALGLDNSVGITNYLIGNIPLTDILKEVPNQPGLYVLSSGPVPPNPAEILLSDKVDELLQHLREQFDYVVIDCPPIGLVSDAKVLSKQSDVNFYIVRQRYTYKKNLLLVDDLAANGMLPNLGIIINDVTHKGVNNYYGYGGNYGYGYGSYNYNYGYGSDLDQSSNNSLRGRISRLFTGSKND